VYRKARLWISAALMLAATSCGDDMRRPPLANGNGGGPDPNAISGSGGRGGAGLNGDAGSGAMGGTGGALISGPLPPPGPCADIFADDLFPTYELQISQAEWNALLQDFYDVQQNLDAKRDTHPYHRVDQFKYGGEVVNNATIRLKGFSSWSQAIQDHPPKLQFVIAFNDIDQNARFHGLRKIELDMPRIDPTYLRQRVALSFLRALGVPSQCANSASLVINGALYGLYTNLERPDKEFLHRLFPGADHADLWDGGWQLETNQDAAGLPHPRMDAFWAARTTAATAAIADLDQAMLEWAGEAVLGDADGYWIGHWNFLLYDHPTHGWLWLPHDLDAAVNWLNPQIDPLYYWGGDTTNWAPPFQHYVAVIGDDAWRGRYVAALGRAYDVYAAAHLPDLVDRFEAQIRDAAAADPTRPFTFDQHLSEIAYLRQSIAARIDTLRAWLDCQASPASAPDLDGDGRPFCMDCRDDDPATYPGAAEICGDGRDQNCDGIDDTCH
jgi:hypothetical protein